MQENEEGRSQIVAATSVKCFLAVAHEAITALIGINRLKIPTLEGSLTASSINF
jgi:hypothetical protein